MNRISRNIAIILRAERLIARRRMAVMVNQTGLLAFAVLVAGLALVMLNVAAFFALQDNMSPQNAALLVSLADVILAVVIIMVASRMNSDKELEPVVEVRDIAIEDLESEVQDVVVEARELSDNVRRIASDPFGSLIPSLIGPLLSLLARNTKK